VDVGPTGGNTVFVERIAGLYSCFCILYTMSIQYINLFTATSGTFTINCSVDPFFLNTANNFPFMYLKKDIAKTHFLYQLKFPE
jgi:hypothetical protein